MKRCHRICRTGLASLLLAGATLALSAAPVDVKVTRPARGEILRYVTLPGTVKPNQQATLYAKVTGYLKTIKVDKGDTVKAGDLIAVIDVPEVEAELAKSKAELARAKASGAQYAAEEKAASIELKRLTEARKKSPDLVTAQAVDDAQAAVDIAKAKQTAAKAEQDVATAGIKRVETLLAFAKITAPFSGVVTARFADEGAFIPAATSSSSAQSAALVTLMDFNTVRVQVPVTELETPLVSKGQPVKVVVEGLAGKNFNGQVSRLSYALDDASKTMLVEADIPNPQQELRPGMYATAKIGVEKHTDALTIPVEALVMEKVNAFAYAADGAKAKKTAIKIGFNDGAKVEILGGLTGNESVILVGKLALTDGAAINVTETK